LADAVFEELSFQDQSHQVQAAIKWPPVLAQPFADLEHQVEDVVPTAEAPASIGSAPYPTDD